MIFNLVSLELGLSNFCNRDIGTFRFVIQRERQNLPHIRYDVREGLF